MLWIALGGFLMAAGGGAVMARHRMKHGGNPPKFLVAVHGMAATFGLVSLIVLLPGEPPGLVQACFFAFVAAATGGLVLLTFHARGVVLPGALVIGHGLLAVAAICLLTFAALKVPDEARPDREEADRGREGTLR